MDKHYNWEYENSISYNKEYINPDDYNSPSYVPLRTISILSNSADTILLANEMNINPSLDDKLQHDYLFYSVRPKKRFFKRDRKTDFNVFKLIQNYYKYNNKRTQEALNILTEEQINIIIKKQKKGGIT